MRSLTAVRPLPAVRPYPVQPAPVGSHDDNPASVTLPLTGGIPDEPDIQIDPPHDRYEAAVRETRAHKLNGVQSAVLRHVAHKAGPPRGECFQSQAEIALDIGFSVRKVGPALRQLVQLGLLAGLQRFGATTVYRLVDHCSNSAPLAELGPSESTDPRTAVQFGKGCRLTLPLPSHPLRKRGGESSQSDTPPPLSGSDPEGRGDGQSGIPCRIEADTIREAVDKHADAHSWRSTGAAVSHYLKNPDKFTVDLATWESEAEHAPKVNPRTGQVYRSAGERRKQSERSFLPSTGESRPRKRVNGYY